MSKGKFIVLEGLDGSGKTVNISNAVSHFNMMNLSLQTVSEYHDSTVSTSIRDILNNQDPRIDPVAEGLLFYASRIEHTNKIIKPYLEAGVNVIADRYYYSTLAYQSVAYPDITKIHNMLTEHLIKPDLTLLLDIDSSTYIHRVLSRNEGLDSIESRGNEYFSKVRQTYLELADKDDSFVVVNANKPLKVVFDGVVSLISDLIAL